MPVLGQGPWSGVVAPWALAALLSIALLLASAGLRQARDDAAESRLQHQTLQAGDFVPEARILTRSGRTVAIGSPGEDSVDVIFLLTTSCEYCRASVPAWNSLADTISAYGLRASLIAASTDSLLVALVSADSLGLMSRLGVFTSARHVSLFRARIVPQFAVVAPDGRVRYARLGTLTAGPALDSLMSAIRSLAPTQDIARAQ